MNETHFPCYVVNMAWKDTINGTIYINDVYSV